MNYAVTLFSPYAFTVGEKIHIDSGRRKGDWEVAAVADNTVTLRCPVSKKEFTWKKFCYFIDKKQTNIWPGES
ncbi:hypothetical protein [Desulfomarina sp.]